VTRAFSRWTVALTAALLLAAAPRVHAQGGGDARVPQGVRESAAQDGSVRVIVRVRAAWRMEGRLDRTAAAAQRARIRERLRDVIDRVPGLTRARRFQLIPAFAAEVDAATLAELAGDPDVEAIEIDRRMRPALAQSRDIVGAPQTWAAGYTGRGWTVAVLDTGIDTSHPFFAGKVVSEACYSNNGGTANGTSLCPAGAASSIAPGSGRHCGFTGCDHGTHVAGIAAGRSANLTGIARDANLISIQVFTRFDTSADCGSQVPCLLSYASDEILALERIFSLRETYNIAAVNMSLGGGRYFSQSRCDAENASLKAAIDQLRSVGIATVASTGNEGYFDSISAPACISSAISVGATTKSDNISSFTNAAPFMSLLAPGSSITSSVPGGGFDVKNGTSMAAPHVAGAWALLKERRPSASVAQVLTALRSTGVPRIDSLTNIAYPRIRIDAAATALQLTQLAIDTPVNGQVVGGTFSVAGWALDPTAPSGTGVDLVHVWAYPASGAAPIFLGAADYGGSRPDVGGLFGSEFTPSSFGLTVNGLAAGPYRIVAYARSIVSGVFDAAREVRITVAGTISMPSGAIDTPGAGATVLPTFTVSGWALDRAAAFGVGVDAVHVYAYPSSGAPVFLGSATPGGARPDVGAAFGAAFSSAGYTLVVNGLAPGAYRIVAYMHSTVSGDFTPLIRDVIVRAPGDPRLMIDTPIDGAIVSSSFVISGWSLDRDATTGSGMDAIHVWAYPLAGGPAIFLGSAAQGGSRPDVAFFFGSAFAQCGYDLAVTGIAPGAYDIVVYAHSNVSNTFAAARTVRVNVRE
jgi:subtilisin family serine protease